MKDRTPILQMYIRYIRTPSALTIY